MRGQSACLELCTRLANFRLFYRPSDAKLTHLTTDELDWLYVIIFIPFNLSHLLLKNRSLVQNKNMGLSFIKLFKKFIDRRVSIPERVCLFLKFALVLLKHKSIVWQHAHVFSVFGLLVLSLNPCSPLYLNRKCWRYHANILILLAERWNFFLSFINGAVKRLPDTNLCLVELLFAFAWSNYWKECFFSWWTAAISTNLSAGDIEMVKISFP